MFSVTFEVQPRAEQWNAYLDKAKMLRPELEQIDGFVDNIRYRSLTREGLILSLSGWRDEKSLVRWRTKVRHHDAQAKGRSEILQNYHLRVGQVTKDNQLPPGHALCEQRLDETEVGEGTTITLINATRPKAWTETGNAAAEAFDNEFTVPDGFRARRVRVVRDYGMFDRREAPQYYPAIELRAEPMERN